MIIEPTEYGTVFEGTVFEASLIQKGVDPPYSLTSCFLTSCFPAFPCSSLQFSVFMVCACVCVCVCEVFFPFDGKVNMMLTVLVDHYRSWVMECTCCLVEMVAFLDEPVD